MMVCQKQKQMKERRWENKPILLLFFLFTFVAILTESFSLKIPRSFNMTDVIITTTISLHPNFSRMFRERTLDENVIEKDRIRYQPVVK